MKAFKVISYYTNDWDYPAYAKKLQQDCQRLGLDYHIVEKPSTNSYISNCQIKAFFIRDMMAEFKIPLLWMDVDGSICRMPQLLSNDSMAEYDMAGNHPLNHPERVHVGSIWFNHSPAAVEFVNQWCAGIERKNGIDDAAFNGTWDLYKHQIKFFALPPEYFRILPRPERDIPHDVVIAHRLSNSSLKREYKHMVEKKSSSAQRPIANA